MSTVEEIMSHARHLPLRERLRLLGQLEDAIAAEDRTEAAATDVPAYAATIALLGKVHSDHVNVATEKYAHLGAIYASESGEAPPAASRA